MVIPSAKNDFNVNKAQEEIWNSGLHLLLNQNKAKSERELYKILKIASARMYKSWQNESRVCIETWFPLYFSKPNVRCWLSYYSE